MNRLAGLLAVALAASADTGTAAPLEPLFPPWKKEADCYWVLTYPDGVAHRAWIAAGDGGVFLNIVDDSIESLPVSDALSIVLVADGAAGRSVTTLGSHRDGDGATLLTLILDEPQRALIAGAKQVELTREGGPSFTLPLAGTPSASALDSCDTNPGPAEFGEEH